MHSECVASNIRAREFALTWGRIVCADAVNSSTTPRSRACTLPTPDLGSIAVCLHPNTDGECLDLMGHTGAARRAERRERVDARRKRDICIDVTDGSGMGGKGAEGGGVRGGFVILGGSGM